LQKQSIRSRMLSRLPTTGLSADMYLQGVNDRRSNVILNREDVSQCPIISLGPEMCAVFDMDKLGGDTRLITRFAHRPFEHRLDAECLAYRPDVFVFALERKRRRSGNHLQILDFGQQIEYLLGQPVRKVL